MITTFNPAMQEHILRIKDDEIHNLWHIIYKMSW